jgi:hypothetical protein
MQFIVTGAALFTRACPSRPRHYTLAQRSSPKQGEVVAYALVR